MEENAAGGIVWGEAVSPEEKEDVYRFRFRQYFFSKTSLPGVDAAHGRVWLPHDDVSRHLTARDGTGSLVAVGSTTPASAPAISAEWKALFDFGRISSILDDMMIISRVIVSEHARRSPLFGQMILRLAGLGIQSGFHCAAHYCAPSMIALYERLGYRVLGYGSLLGDSFRVPMILSIDAMENLRRVHSPVITLLEAYSPDPARLRAITELCPEMARPPLCSLSKEDALLLFTKLCPSLRISGNARLHTLRRAGIFRIRQRCTLSRPGHDEGAFLVLKGCMADGESEMGPGTFFSSGSHLFTAREDCLLASLPN